MANVKSAEKRNRQNIKRRERNRPNKTIAKSAAHVALEAIKKDAKGALKVISQVASTIAKSAHKGGLPKKRAARKISRLYKARNKAMASS